jgi:NADPH:quinone reductase-like Zn-dependent oxidoreductase
MHTFLAGLFDLAMTHAVHRRRSATGRMMGTGGVALFALQFAKMAGARVIATTTSPSKMDLLRELGAEAVVDASNGLGWHEGVLEAIDGRGVDVTVEVGGGATWPDSGMATRNAGRMSLVGALSQSTENIPSMFMQRCIHSGPTRVGSRLHFEQMNRAIALHDLHPSSTGPSPSATRRRHSRNSAVACACQSCDQQSLTRTATRSRERVA